METKEYILKINIESKNILISGISSNPVLIDISRDIDFTKLVDELTKAIDGKYKLVPKTDNDTSDDNNIKIILETIDSIIVEYNNTITALYSQDSVIEQTEISVPLSSATGINDDLPF